MFESQKSTRGEEVALPSELAPDTWDLSSITGQNLDDMQASITQEVEHLLTFQESMHEAMDPADFYLALTSYQELQGSIQELEARVRLPYLRDKSDARAHEEMESTTTFIAEIQKSVEFFKVSFADLSDSAAKKLIECAPHSVSFLRNIRLDTEHEVSTSEKAHFNEKERALENRYDSIVDTLTYTIRGQPVSLKELKKDFSSPDREVREFAYKARVDTVREHETSLFDLYRERVLLWSEECSQEARNFPAAMAMRTFENRITAETEEALLSACMDNRQLFQGFLQRKQAALQLPDFKHSDILAPVASRALSLTYREARDSVLDSFTAFSETFGTIAKAMHSRGHIDAEPRLTKRAHGSCQWAGPHSLPYNVETFLGTLPAAVTKAHEMGHAVHSTLAQAQGSLGWWPGLAVAETAASLGEQIFLEHYTRANPELRQELLFFRVTDAFDAILETAARHQFETKAHEAILNGASIEDIHELYLSGLKEQYGPNVHVDDSYAAEWLSIGQMFYSPFYSNAYTFGGLAANVLHSRAALDGGAYIKKIEDALRAGGATTPLLLFKNLGFDIESQSDWQVGFENIQSLIAKLQS
jgi:oligoendopeptidase F